MWGCDQAKCMQVLTLLHEHCLLLQEQFELNLKGVELFLDELPCGSFVLSSFFLRSFVSEISLSRAPIVARMSAMVAADESLERRPQRDIEDQGYVFRSWF